jgi:inorganic triphosphatase YgiF
VAVTRPPRTTRPLAGGEGAALEHLLTQARGLRPPDLAKGAGGVRVTPKQAEEILRAEAAHKGGKNAVEEALAELLHPAGADGSLHAGTAK